MHLRARDDLELSRDDNANGLKSIKPPRGEGCLTTKDVAVPWRNGSACTSGTIQAIPGLMVPRPCYEATKATGTCPEVNDVVPSVGL
jgi:hypothetical protein